jgi:hypothetical protein
MLYLQSAHSIHLTVTGYGPGATEPMNMYALLLHILQLLPSAAHFICPEVHPVDPPPLADVVVLAGEVVCLGEVVIPGETVLGVGDLVAGVLLTVANY